MWGLIGGSMEIGETLEQTARREAQEESGLIIEDLEWFALFSGQELIYTLPHGDVVVNVVASYIVRSFQGSLCYDDNESSALRFFALDALPKAISPPDRPVIAAFLQQV
jgi:8-oxo-dGTP pyrophosphatase MutT (NUDIX family)